MVGQVTLNNDLIEMLAHLTVNGWLVHIKSFSAITYPQGLGGPMYYRADVATLGSDVATTRNNIKKVNIIDNRFCYKILTNN